MGITLLLAVIANQSPGDWPGHLTPAVDSHVAVPSAASIPRPPDSNEAPRSQPGYVPRTFHGYGCLDDCSGHEAGYEWAEENDIADPDDCDGNSESFIEGCRAYADERQQEQEEDED